MPDSSDTKLDSIHPNCALPKSIHASMHESRKPSTVNASRLPTLRSTIEPNTGESSARGMNSTK